MNNATPNQSYHAPEWALSEIECRRYWRDGFLVVRNVFREAEIAEIRACFDRMFETSQALGETKERDGSLFVIEQSPKQCIDTFALLRVVWAGGAEPFLETLGGDRRLLGLAACLLQSTEMVQLINQAHFKRPGDGVWFPWHQDSKHRRQGTELFDDLNGKGSFVESLLAIDPMADDNGPIEVLVGSHREGHLSEILSQRLPQLESRYPRITINMNPGDVLLMSPFTVHQSLPNQGRRSRYTFLNGYALPGASRRIYPGCGLGLKRQLSEP